MREVDIGRDAFVIGMGEVKVQGQRIKAEMADRFWLGADLAQADLLVTLETRQVLRERVEQLTPIGGGCVWPGGLS